MSDLKVKPEVCAIIPVFNRAGLIGRTLDSLLNQTLPLTEIIVVDDHSADDIRGALKPYEGKIRHYLNGGKGPGAARNLGMSVSRAPIIQFFDSDDLLTRDKIEQQGNLLVAKNLDMVYGPYAMASVSDGSETGWKQEDIIMQSRPLPDANLNKWILRGWNTITQACLFRRSFLEQCLPWDEKMITYEDYLYLFRLSLHNPKIGHSPNGAVLYRQHGGQSTLGHTQALSRSSDKIRVMELMQHETQWHKQGYLTKTLFLGRLEDTKRYHRKLESQGNEGSADNTSSKNRLFYKFFNKFERLKTGTAWETMHGIDKSPGSFDTLVRQLA
jgi:glycosyltransferase involved in cell wall biosynthesis